MLLDLCATFVMINIIIIEPISDVIRIIFASFSVTYLSTNRLCIILHFRHMIY